MTLFKRNTNVIDLRDALDDAAALAEEEALVVAVLRWYHEDQVLAFGVPTRCPACGSYGLVDRLDAVRGASHNSCVSCSETWTLTRRALSSIGQPSMGQPAMRQALGDGILLRDL